jgi:hypothetical protein
MRLDARCRQPDELQHQNDQNNNDFIRCLHLHAVVLADGQRDAAPDYGRPAPLKMMH